MSINTRLEVNNITTLMLLNENNWRIISKWIETVISQKESDERNLKREAMR